jgi:hypothetical protein
MSIARDGRDTSASLYYLECLDRLREQHLERSLRGEALPENYWKLGEADALARTRRLHFTAAIRSMIMPPEKAAAMSDEQDFEARTTKLVEMGMLESHRALVRIPWVGQKEYADSSPVVPR